jgi:peroxiredoxin
MIRRGAFTEIVAEIAAGEALLMLRKTMLRRTRQTVRQFGETRAGSYRLLLIVVPVLTGVLLGLSGVAVAKAKFNRVVSVGDIAPRWSNLPGTDGAKHSFDDFKEASVLVVVFTCNHCPVAKGYEDRLIGFVEKYRGRGVTLVAINVNTGKVDRLDKMRERAAARGFNFTYLFDESQQTARAYGATVTPHAFVLDGKRRIAYMGAFDDQNEPDRVRRHYVIDAVEAVLAGRAPAIPESLQRGCGIQYENR